jgi:hypothetical protein
LSSFPWSTQVQDGRDVESASGAAAAPLVSGVVAAARGKARRRRGLGRRLNGVPRPASGSVSPSSLAAAAAGLPPPLLPIVRNGCVLPPSDVRELLSRLDADRRAFAGASWGDFSSSEDDDDDGEREKEAAAAGPGSSTSSSSKVLRCAVPDDLAAADACLVGDVEVLLKQEHDDQILYLVRDTPR